MGVTFAPATAPIKVMQDRVARPSTCTVQAPQKPIPQPNFVPVSPSSSRITQSNAASSGLCTETVLPLRSNVVMIDSLLFSLLVNAMPSTLGGWQRPFSPDRSRAGISCGCDADKLRARRSLRRLGASIEALPAPANLPVFYTFPCEG